jgi:hypothetical protein
MDTLDPFHDIGIEQGLSAQDHRMTYLYLGGPAFEIFCIVIPGLPASEMVVVVAIATVTGEVAYVGDVELQSIDEYAVSHGYVL